MAPHKHTATATATTTATATATASRVHRGSGSIWLATTTTTIIIIRPDSRRQHFAPRKILIDAGQSVALIVSSDGHWKFAGWTWKPHTRLLNGACKWTLPYQQPTACAKQTAETRKGITRAPCLLWHLSRLLHINKFYLWISFIPEAAKITDGRADGQTDGRTTSGATSSARAH